MPRLKNGDPLPAVEFKTAGGNQFRLPEDLAGSFGVVLIYRGAWCPVCKSQLSGYVEAKSTLEELGIKVVALSVDDEATSAQFAKQIGAAFPIGYGADPDTIAAVTGAFTNPDPHYLQPTSFIVAPNGTVLSILYSSSAVGRLSAAEAIRFIQVVRSRLGT